VSGSQPPFNAACALETAMRIYIATVRVTEISLGVIETATVSHIILPSPVGASLWRAIGDVRLELADYALAVLGNGDMAPGARNSSARRFRSRIRVRQHSSKTARSQPKQLSSFFLMQS